MMMKMLEAGGLSILQDGIRVANEDNPKGYFEDERVKDLHQDVDKSWLAASRGKVVKIISFLLPHLPETNNYRVLFMRRNLQEVLASQAKMLERRGEKSDTSDEKMLELWKDHLHELDMLRAGIGLRAYGQKDPLSEYKRESFEMFGHMKERIENDAVRFLFLLEPMSAEEREREQQKRRREQAQIFAAASRSASVRPMSAPSSTMPSPSVSLSSSKDQAKPALTWKLWATRFLTASEM